MLPLAQADPRLDARGFPRPPEQRHYAHEYEVRRFQDQNNIESPISYLDPPKLIVYEDKL